MAAGNSIEPFILVAVAAYLPLYSLSTPERLFKQKWSPACGTGKHIFDVAVQNPKARVLAIDISVASLAYAKRKVREERLVNIEFAQADILELGAIGRVFDHIEASECCIISPTRRPDGAFCYRCCGQAAPCMSASTAS